MAREAARLGVGDGRRFGGGERAGPVGGAAGAVGVVGEAVGEAAGGVADGDHGSEAAGVERARPARGGSAEGTGRGLPGGVAQVTGTRRAVPKRLARGRTARRGARAFGHRCRQVAGVPDDEAVVAGRPVEAGDVAGGVVLEVGGDAVEGRGGSSRFRLSWEGVSSAAVRDGRGLLSGLTRLLSRPKPWLRNRGRVVVRVRVHRRRSEEWVVRPLLHVAEDVRQCAPRRPRRGPRASRMRLTCCLRMSEPKSPSRSRPFPQRYLLLFLAVSLE